MSKKERVPFEVKCEICGASIIALRATRKYCDACNKARNLEMSARGKKKRLEREPDYKSKENKSFYYNHREEMIARSVQYGKNHPEWRRQSFANWIKNNPERWKEHCAKQYKKFPERFKRNRENWIKNNYERHRQNSQTRLVRYRARLANAEGNHTADEFQQKCAEQNWLCFYCGEFMEKATEDHIIPLSRGGSNWIENIAGACPHCNYQKRNKTADEYFEWLLKEQGT